MLCYFFFSGVDRGDFKIIEKKVAIGTPLRVNLIIDLIYNLSVPYNTLFHVSITVSGSFGRVSHTPLHGSRLQRPHDHIRPL